MAANNLFTNNACEEAHHAGHEEQHHQQETETQRAPELRDRVASAMAPLAFWRKEETNDALGDGSIILPATDTQEGPEHMRQRVLAAMAPLAFWRKDRAAPELNAHGGLSSMPAAVSGAMAMHRSSYEILVCDPQKASDGIRAYLAYTVSTSQTKLQSTDHRAHNFSVKRRFNDFVWLHAQLWKECEPGLVVPPIPQKNMLLRFDEDVVELRRRALQNFLMRVAVHPKLASCKCFQVFLEAGDEELAELKQNTAESLQGTICHCLVSTASLMQNRLACGSACVREKDETDDLIIAAKKYIDCLECQVNGIYKQTMELGKRKQELASGYSDFAESFELLLQAESSGSNTMLSEIGDCAKQLAVPSKEEASKEMIYFEEPLKFYMQSMSGLRRCLDIQAAKTREYENALRHVSHKQTAHAKLDGVAGQEENAATAATTLQTAHDSVEETRKVYEQTTETCLAEIERFKVDQDNDFNKFVADYRQVQVNFNMQAAKTWQVA